MRLSLYIAKSGCASRRKADTLIKDGKVTVNAVVVKEPFYRVEDKDCVAVCGKTVSPEKYVYLMFNKPRGVVSTREDRHADRTIIDCLPLDLRQPEYRGIFPVGRLDKNSTGLIILTNDGSTAHRITHPKFEVEKEYLVRVIGCVTRDAIDSAVKGVACEGDFLGIKRAVILERADTTTLLKVIITQGKKRHLRRLFFALGFSVVELKRVRIGDLRLGDLKSGEFKILDKNLFLSCFARGRKP